MISTPFTKHLLRLTMTEDRTKQFWASVFPCCHVIACCLSGTGCCSLSREPHTFIPSDIFSNSSSGSQSLSRKQERHSHLFVFHIYFPVFGFVCLIPFVYPWIPPSPAGEGSHKTFPEAKFTFSLANATTYSGGALCASYKSAVV